MKIAHVAEIVNIGHVARILEAEICGAVNVCAIPLYNQHNDDDGDVGAYAAGWQNNFAIEIRVSESP